MTTMKTVDPNSAANPPVVDAAWTALENAVETALAEDQSSDAIREAAVGVALSYYAWGRDDSDRAAIHGLATATLSEPRQLSAVDDSRVIDKWLGVVIVGGTYLVLLLAIVIIAAHRWLW